MKINKKLLSLFISVGIVGIISLLFLLDFYNSAVYKIYDILLHIKPEVEEQQEFLLVDIDDKTIAEVNMYPLSRDMMADSLILMKEMGAEYAVLDIEFVDRSPRGINEDYLTEDLPGYLNETFTLIDQDTSALLDAISNGQIPVDSIDQYKEMLSENTASSSEIISSYIKKISLDFDVYLGQACRYFGKTIVPINMLDTEDNTISEEERMLAADLSLSGLTVQENVLISAVDIRPAIYPVLSGAYELGFPRVFVDNDGVRRRIDLFYDYNGQIYPQLGLSALLDYLGNPEIHIGKKEVILKKAVFPDNSERDVSIPLTSEGKMLINWPKKGYLDSFNHLSFNRLYLHDRFMRDMIHNLKIMRENNYFTFYDSQFNPLNTLNYAEALKTEALENGTPVDIEEYRQVREYFLEEIGIFLNSGVMDAISGEYERILNMEDLPENLRDEYKELQDWVNNTLFPQTTILYNKIEEFRSFLKEKLEAKFCIIGYSATSTTDIGVNPFESEYMNMGLYASVANTILTEKFLKDTPIWINFLIVLLCSVFIGQIVVRLNSVPGLISGLGFLAIVILSLSAIFIFTGIFIDILTPVIAVFLVFTSQVSINFISVGREKRFIRGAFGQYLSDEIISDLIDDPSNLQLGGKEVYMTAMFTDVQKFSTISEKISAIQLVELLNVYLTEMSDIVLAHKGTIDKYEGDAIIAFFGAPREYSEHAVEACRSTVLLKKAEEKLNIRLLAEDKTPTALLTRIGLNTGPMVAGNMGTERKMNYTMMGNNVNLAARLEGVCKQYKIYTLISEATYKETGDLFMVRRLDRVRVVGINTPVRLYNLLDEKLEAPENIVEGVETFHAGMDDFEERNWGKAELLFKNTLKILPEDGPAGIYLQRIEEYKKKEPSKKWDGVYNLTEK